MLARLLLWIQMRIPVRVIAEAGVAYLERGYLCTAFGYRFYLHRFVGSDPDRGYHDHPWPRAWSIVLSGWYYELRRWGVRRVRWFNCLDGDTFHRVLVGDDILDEEIISGALSELPSFAPLPPRFVWTLFWHRADDAKDWGFLRPMPDMADGHLIYYPFTYNGKVKNNRWERVVPRGRDYARDADGVILPNQDFYHAGNEDA